MPRVPRARKFARIAGKAPPAILIDREECDDACRGGDQRKEPVQAGIGGLTAEDHRGHREHDVEAGSIDEVAFHVEPLPSSAEVKSAAALLLTGEPLLIGAGDPLFEQVARARSGILNEL